MNRSLYIAPEIKVVEVEPSAILALSSVGYTSNQARGDYEVLSNQLRDGWVDIWDND